MITKSNGLAFLARAINDREETIQLLKKQTLEKAADTIREAILQGNAFLRVKATLNHGEWLPWVATNCPAIHERTARRYMQLASNPARVSDLIEAGSLRRALALLDEGDAEREQKTETKQWPPYVEAAGRLSKLVGYVERFPLDQWPAEGLEQFKEDLQPIAVKLWPEKFTN